MDITRQLITEFKLKPFQAESAVKLIDDGNTIPFIARYRKEATGEMDDQVLREFSERLEYLRAVEAKKVEITRLIDEQGKMTPELTKDITAAKSLAELEDIYRPYRQKRRTRATIAAEKGLEPLARLLWEQSPDTNPSIEAAKFINAEKGVADADEALAGARDIIAEEVSDSAAYRKWIKEFFHESGVLVSEAKKKEEDSVYRMYYEYREPISRVAPHRCLALDRGEKEGILSVDIEADDEAITRYLLNMTVKKPPVPASAYVSAAVLDAYKRLIFPSVENEVRNDLTERSQEQAMRVFAENLKHLLLCPPVKGRVVMGFDPAYRTGCKIAVVDDTGKVLTTTVVYPTPPQSKVEEAKKELTALVDKYKIDVISIGNGTASKESEMFVAELIRHLKRRVTYMVVSEAGASVYSASKLASQEFPQFDVSLRSAVSIARRLQDPLAELVKIDPKAIGVGQYQHDINPKKLSGTLDGVVEYCVNSVGVDLNTASAPLLSRVAGLSSTVAKNICEFREQSGKFRRRAELMKVKGLGEKAFQQCAGFLRIPGGTETLDNTSVHPESYAAAEKLLGVVGYTMADVREKKIKNLTEEIEIYGWEEVATQAGIGVPTLKDIAAELAKPGRDPRDELPPPLLRTDVLDINSLKEGMELMGTVRNVADFGAFVDIGVHQDGLVHISQLSDKFVKRAMDVVSVGDVVKVRILEVDPVKKRIALKRID